MLHNYKPDFIELRRITSMLSCFFVINTFIYRRGQYHRKLPIPEDIVVQTVVVDTLGEVSYRQKFIKNSVAVCTSEKIDRKTLKMSLIKWNGGLHKHLSTFLIGILSEIQSHLVSPIRADGFGFLYIQNMGSKLFKKRTSICLFISILSKYAWILFHLNTSHFKNRWHLYFF